ncbi:MAG: DUF4214 domain-containing protein, partial [Candidatus Nitrotoga sp.]
YPLPRILAVGLDDSASVAALRKKGYQFDLIAQTTDFSQFYHSDDAVQGSYDIAVCIAAHEAVGDDGPFFSQLADLLSPGGHAILSVCLCDGLAVESVEPDAASHSHDAHRLFETLLGRVEDCVLADKPAWFEETRDFDGGSEACKYASLVFRRLERNVWKYDGKFRAIQAAPWKEYLHKQQLRRDVEILELANSARKQSEEMSALESEKRYLHEQLQQRNAENQRMSERAREQNAEIRVLQSNQTAREQALFQQVRDGQQEQYRLLQEQTKREKEYNEQIMGANQKLASLLHDSAQREKDTSGQMLALRQWMDKEKSELEQAYSDHISSLQRELARVRSSLSWRLTAPFRIMARWMGISQTTADHLSDASARPVKTRRAVSESHITVPNNQNIASDAPKDGTRMNHSTFAQATDLNKSTKKLALSDLLQQQDVHFVESAYLTILGRQADPVGQDYYLSRLRAGVPKVEILGQLLNSAEARQRREGIPGLRDALRLQKLVGIPVIGPLFNLFMAGDRFGQAADLNEPGAAPNLKTLLQHQDLWFIESAYLTLLRRQPDPVGQNYYLGRLRAGVPKVVILGQLFHSAEARQSQGDIPGLRNAVRLQTLAGLPVIGPILKLFNAADGASSHEIRLRAIEQQLFILGQQINARLKLIEHGINNLQNVIPKQGRAEKPVSPKETPVDDQPRQIEV